MREEKARKALVKEKLSHPFDKVEDLALLDLHFFLCASDGDALRHVWGGRVTQHRAEAPPRSLQSSIYQMTATHPLAHPVVLFAKPDAAPFRLLGMNCVRSAIGQCHFKDDLRPQVLELEGLKGLNYVLIASSA